MAVKTLTIDDLLVSARKAETILDAAREASIPSNIHIPICAMAILKEVFLCYVLMFLKPI